MYNFIGWPLFHNGPLEHDRHPVADLPGESDIMGDQKEGKPSLLLEVKEEPQYLCLDTGIQCRCGFICEIG